MTASAWPTIWAATQRAAERRRGTDGDAPRLSNGDAASLVSAWTRVVSPQEFRLWYQFAAAAYGWNGRRRDVINATAKQRDAIMPSALSRELWQATEALACDLDETDAPARLEIDDGVFDDPVFQGSVKAALRGDGAIAALLTNRRRPRQNTVGDVSGKVPLCANPKLGCPPGYKLIQPSPGVFACRNETTGDVKQPSMQCDEVVWIDDPLTFAGNELAKLALIVIGVIVAANLLTNSRGRDGRNR